MLSLPYLQIDNELDLNSSLLILLLDKLAINKNKNFKLDFSKLQFFLYLLKNPSKINKVLEISGRKLAILEDRFIFTIESESVNVDILYDKKRIRVLLRYLSIKGLLSVHNGSAGEIFFSLTEAGTDLSKKLKSNYLTSIRMHLDNLKVLQSLSSSKLFSILNQMFKGY
jgi:hypothetical protein